MWGYGALRRSTRHTPHAPNLLLVRRRASLQKLSWALLRRTPANIRYRRIFIIELVEE